MQISRHWRMQSQRYQLKGYKYEDGVYSLQPRVRYKSEEDQMQDSVMQDEEQAIPVENWPVSADLKNRR